LGEVWYQVSHLGLVSMLVDVPLVEEDATRRFDGCLEFQGKVSRSLDSRLRMFHPHSRVIAGFGGHVFCDT
jgi:hypothetical protein